MIDFATGAAHRTHTKKEGKRKKERNKEKKKERKRKEGGTEEGRKQVGRKERRRKGGRKLIISCSHLPSPVITLTCHLIFPH